MLAIRGHFDGKVIVPDEPVDLPTNQRIIIHIQSVDQQTPDFRAWLGLGLRAPKNPKPRFETDDDLWES